MATTKKKTTKNKKSVRKHEVRAELHNVHLVKARSALTLAIYANRKKLGELQIGRGSLYWWGAKRQRPHKVDWTRFAEEMDKVAYGSP